MVLGLFRRLRRREPEVIYEELSQPYHKMKLPNGEELYVKEVISTDIPGQIFVVDSKGVVHVVNTMAGENRETSRDSRVEEKVLEDLTGDKDYEEIST